MQLTSNADGNQAGIATRPQRRSWWRGNRFRKRVLPWLFIAPITLIHLVVVVGPSLSGMYYSLTDWSGIGPAEFVGLENFRRLIFDDDNFRLAFRHNILWLVFFMTVPFVMALAVASLLAQVRRGSMIFRTAFFVPYVLPSVVAAAIWRLTWLARKAARSPSAACVPAGCRSQ